MDRNPNGTPVLVGHDFLGARSPRSTHSAAFTFYVVSNAPSWSATRLRSRTQHRLGNRATSSGLVVSTQPFDFISSKWLGSATQFRPQGNQSRVVGKPEVMAQVVSGIQAGERKGLVNGIIAEVALGRTPRSFLLFVPPFLQPFAASFLIKRNQEDSIQAEFVTPVGQ
jgi:hypothetical protein